MLEQFKATGRSILPRRLWRRLSLLRWRGPYVLRNWRDLPACAAFLADPTVRISPRQRLRIVRQVYATSLNIVSPHTEREIFSYIRTITSLPDDSPRTVVEAGCYKGISTAKFSLAAAAMDRRLLVFDSFQGIPAHDEPHDRTIFGGPAHFEAGEYAWGLGRVKANIAKYGRLDHCRFVEGWFEDTLPRFREPLAAVYLDVDLASSTRTCIKHLYPLLAPGGVMYSQDGHLPLVIAVLDDEAFWRDEVGCDKPPMFGLGKRKLVKIVKPKHG